MNSTVPQSGFIRNGRVAWGKYEGQPLKDVPEPYLHFLIAGSQATVEQLQAELDRRAQIEEASQPTVRRIVDAGYRELAKRCHPDSGGDPDAMRELNAAVSALRALLEGG
jgi:hypothetical protein